VKSPISIIDISSVSALGLAKEEIEFSYNNENCFFSKTKVENASVWVSKVGNTVEEKLRILKAEGYDKLDRTVLLALLASRSFKDKIDKTGVGVNIGSSRGATELFEKYHEEFLKTSSTPVLTSPTTTLGNISSWVAQDLALSGPRLSHSVTCSTALHAMLNGIAWLESNMASQFLVGGSEAPLTPFTIAQMRALKLYSNLDTELPCESLKFDKKKNTMVLGEAASVALLQKGIVENAKAIIAGFGYASETLQHNVSISAEASCFQDSMKMALQNANTSGVDAVVMHAPGTVKGDIAEYKAIEKVFGSNMPLLTTNKWKIGHTLGASGMMSIEFAMLMLQENKLYPHPFYKNKPTQKSINSVIVNAVGFGGNAVSILLTKPYI